MSKGWLKTCTSKAKALMCGFLGVYYSLHILEGIPQARVGKSSIINLKKEKVLVVFLILITHLFPYFEYRSVERLPFFHLSAKTTIEIFWRFLKWGYMILDVWANCVVGKLLLLNMQTTRYYRKRFFFFFKYGFGIITALANKHGKMFWFVVYIF